MRSFFLYPCLLVELCPHKVFCLQSVYMNRLRYMFFYLQHNLTRWKYSSLICWFILHLKIRLNYVHTVCDTDPDILMNDYFSHCFPKKMNAQTTIIDPYIQMGSIHIYNFFIFICSCFGRPHFMCVTSFLVFSSNRHYFIYRNSIKMWSAKWEWRHTHTHTHMHTHRVTDSQAFYASMCENWEGEREKKIIRLRTIPTCKTLYVSCFMKYAIY